MTICYSKVLQSPSSLDLLASQKKERRINMLETEVAINKNEVNSRIQLSLNFSYIELESNV